jgi:hypothetical protein
MWMHCETWRPEIVHTYIGGPTLSRAPQIAIPKRRESKPRAIHSLSAFAAAAVIITTLFPL